MFNELTDNIEKLMQDNDQVVVGISGFPGSGKSTLADRLKSHFINADSHVVRLDNLYTPLPRGTGLFDDYDWTLLRRIVDDVHTGKPLQYRGRGFEGEVLLFDVPPPKIAIVEGIRLFRRQFMDNFNLSVWVDCPPDLALDRAKSRDLGQGNDEAYMQRWDTEWAPKSLEYYRTYHPEHLADFIYLEYM